MNLIISALLAVVVQAQGATNSAASATPRVFSIMDTGAVGDGATLNTVKIQSAIDRLATNGGGTVVVPRGVFMTGALFLRPGVNIHLEKDAALKGSSDMKNYPLRRIRIEGHFEENYNSGLINADGCHGLKITGEGTLDGNGRTVWDLFWNLRRSAKDQKNFRNLSIPRAQLCIINNSTNVTVDGVTFKDSQFWNLHLYRCRDVLVQDARFIVPDDYKQAPSTDGIDVDSSQRVTIKGCYFSVTDDCIAMKGSKGPFAMEDKDSPPVEEIRIEGCTFKRGGSVVTLGSEATVVRDVVVKNCKVVGPVNVAVLKLRPDTPQRYEDIHISNVTLNADKGSILAIKPWTQYFDLKGQPPPKSVVRNITLTNIKGRYGAFGEIRGNPGQTEISDITLENFDVHLKDEKLKAGREVKRLKCEKVSVNGKLVSQ